MTTEFKKLGSFRHGLQGREALPEADQCPDCGFYFLTSEVLRVIGERTNPRISPSNAECRCNQKERYAERMRQRLANLPNNHQPKSFDEFEVHPGCKDALAAIRLFISGSMDEKILMLSGSVGTGKSHLIEAALRFALEQKISVRYEYVPDLLAALRATYSDQQEGSTDELLKTIASPSILALDDVGAQKTTDFVREQLTRIVENRIQTVGRLIVATNQNHDDMADSIGERIADRLFARNARLVKGVALTCESYRTGG